jgi:hypothetical protein
MAVEQAKQNRLFWPEFAGLSNVPADLPSDFLFHPIKEIVDICLRLVV